MKKYRIIYRDRVNARHEGFVTAKNKKAAWFAGMIDYPNAWDVLYIYPTNKK